MPKIFEDNFDDDDDNDDDHAVAHDESYHIVNVDDTYTNDPHTYETKED